MATIAFVVVIIAFILRLKFLCLLGLLLLSLSVMSDYASILSSISGWDVNSIVAVMVIGIVITVFWMYIRGKEEKEQRKQDNSQSNLA